MKIKTPTRLEPRRLVMLVVTHGLSGDFGFNVFRGGPGYTPCITNLSGVQPRRRFFFFFSFVVHFVFRHFLFFLSSFSFPFVFPFVLCIGYFCSKISWLRNVLFISFRFFHVHINILLIWRNLREILKFLFFSFLFFFFINKFQIQIAWNVS